MLVTTLGNIKQKLCNDDINEKIVSTFYKFFDKSSQKELQSKSL